MKKSMLEVVDERSAGALLTSSGSNWKACDIVLRSTGTGQDKADDEWKVAR